MKYYANFLANWSTHFARPITCTNKKRLVKIIKNTAKAERFYGNQASYNVWYYDSQDNEIIVESGVIDDNGIHIRKEY